MRRAPRQWGFSLIEALVALAVVTLTMTVGMALLAQESEVSRRVEAHQEAVRAIEAALEGIRAGAVPLASGPVEVPMAAAESEAMLVWLEVTPKAKPAGLIEVVVEARYVVGLRTLRRAVRTMVWVSP